MAEGNSVTGIKVLFIGPLFTKVVLLGDAAAGKSSLLTRFTTGEFNAHSDSTIGAAFKSKSAYVFPDSSCRVLAQGNKCIRLDIWDTAGQVSSLCLVLYTQERYRSILPMYYRNAAAAVLVVDITQSESLKVADRWIMDIRQKTDGADCYVILAANKVDLPDRKVSLEEITSFCEEKSYLFNTLFNYRY